MTLGGALVAGVPRTGASAAVASPHDDRENVVKAYVLAEGYDPSDDLATGI